MKREDTEVLRRDESVVEKNPIVGHTAAETLENCRAVLAWIHLSDGSTFGTHEVDEDILAGRYRLVECLQAALATLKAG